MISKLHLKFLILILFLIPAALKAQTYPDQHYILRIDSIYYNIESSSGIRLNSEGKSLELEENIKEGWAILKPQYSEYPYNQGLPSWNGTAPGNNSSFKVQMRFPYGSSWSSWLTVGFWKNNIWSTYGNKTFAEGEVDIDYVKLNVYKSSWQFKVILTRTSVTYPSPTIHMLSYFVSDSRTTANANITQIAADNPAEIFYPTQFVYQYGVDPVIGPSICSPTSVSMILKSYNKEVNTYTFAQETYDPYFKLFGVWPRVVQNASEFGLDGTVNRYRSWSEAREVLAKGGRIAMSLGSPLYPSGHLVMLAGFNSAGTPIVHDPAKSSGYSYVFNKSSLSSSWFSKGGIAYTFYPADTINVIAGYPDDNLIVSEYKLHQNYPNPFNPSTTISYTLTNSGYVHLTILDVLGQAIVTLVNEEKAAGFYEVNFDGSNLTSGIYLYKLQAGPHTEIKKMILMK